MKDKFVMMLSKCLKDAGTIDRDLLEFYSGESITDFRNDIKYVYKLKRELNKIVNGGSIDYNRMINKFIILYNTFGVKGLRLILDKYFRCNKKLFCIFYTLICFYFGIKRDSKIINIFLIDDNFYEWLCANKK